MRRLFIGALALIAICSQIVCADDKDYANAYNNRAFAYAEQGNYKQATQDARKARELGNGEALQYLSENKLIQD
ncbi:MAG: hypothetical protein LBP89_00790 [Helicobacteraceae bacterium]|jgi:hypothetical protein|nr:hypothetical protein [Helicobacteraceae bacterium]